MPASAATMSQAGDILRMDAAALQWQIIAIKWGDVATGDGKYEVKTAVHWSPNLLQTA